MAAGQLKDQLAACLIKYFAQMNGRAPGTFSHPRASGLLLKKYLSVI